MDKKLIAKGWGVRGKQICVSALKEGFGSRQGGKKRAYEKKKLTMCRCTFPEGALRKKGEILRRIKAIAHIKLR